MAFSLSGMVVQASIVKYHGLDDLSNRKILFFFIVLELSEFEIEVPVWLGSGEDSLVTEGSLLTVALHSGATTLMLLPFLIKAQFS